jgi:hypothetical protein
MCRRIAGLFHPEHLHDLVAQMIDHLDRNATLGRFVERARSIAVERRTQVSREKDGKSGLVSARIGRCQRRPAWRGPCAAVPRRYM